MTSSSYGPFEQRGPHIMALGGRREYSFTYGDKIGQAIGPENDPETLANAALFAASWTMREALKALVERVELMARTGDSICPVELIQKARDAIVRSEI